jgi:ABC-type multidrug transport system ATPase subunit
MKPTNHVFFYWRRIGIVNVQGRFYSELTVRQIYDFDGIVRSRRGTAPSGRVGLHPEMNI